MPKLVLKKLELELEASKREKSSSERKESNKKCVDILNLRREPRERMMIYWSMNCIWYLIVAMLVAA